MNYIERNIYVTENRIKSKIDYTRGTNALPIYFHFMDFEIPEGAEAKVFVLKPSKRATYNVCPIIDNTVRVIVKDQTFAEIGKNLLQIAISKAEDTLVTFEQEVEVHRNFTEGDIPESKNEAGWIDGFIKGMEEATERAKKASEKAEQIQQTLEQKLKNGEFTGEKGPQGPPGRDANAVITSLEPGIFALSIEKGHLLLIYNATEEAPPLKIVDGRLKYILGESA